MRFLTVTCAVSALAVLAAPPGAGGPPAPAPFLEKDTAELLRLLEGTWSNDRQALFSTEAGDRAGSLVPLQVMHVRPEPGGGLRLVIRTEVDGREAREQVHQVSVTGASGEPGGSIAEPGAGPAACRMTWQRAAGGFTGSLAGAGCGPDLPFQPGAEAAPLTVSVSGSELFMSDGAREIRFRRARPFDCWAGVLRGASHGDSGEGLSDWDFRQGIRLHDQGGEAQIETGETPPRRISLKLRDVDWPFGERRPSLTLYVHEAGDPRAVSYAWAEGGADRIGINLRWIQASCTRQGAGD
mgnify:CR=1 FL=1|jgi:hypothetical protein